MKPSSSVRGAVLLVVLAVVAGVGLLVGTFVPAPGGKGASWLAPKTWTSHKAADAVDTANVKVTDSNAQVIHAAHVEASKLGETLVHIPDGPEKVLAQRFSLNSLSLLGQVDTVTLQENVALKAMVIDLLSKDAARVAIAEERQIAAERTVGALSNENKTLKENLVKVQGALRIDAEEKIAAYNQLETEHAHKIILYIVVALLLLGLIYLRVAFGGVGQTLHHLEGNPQYGAVVQELDSNVGALGKWFIRSSKNATAFAEAKLEQARKSFSPPTAT